MAAFVAQHGRSDPPSTRRWNKSLCKTTKEQLSTGSTDFTYVRTYYGYTYVFVVPTTTTHVSLLPNIPTGEITVPRTELYCPCCATTSNQPEEIFPSRRLFKRQEWQGFSPRKERLSRSWVF